MEKKYLKIKIKKKVKKKIKLNKDFSFELNDESNKEQDLENRKNKNISSSIYFFYKDRNGNGKSNTFHRIYKQFYYLRCTDRRLKEKFIKDNYQIIY